MPRIVRIIVTATLAVACLPGAQLEQGPGIVGTYVVNGVDPNGTEYTGRVSIGPGSDSGSYVIDWVITGAILEGTGILEGDTLSVTWETVDGPRGLSSGTAEYEVLGDGTLVGTRAVAGFDRVGTETIYPEP